MSPRWFCSLQDRNWRNAFPNFKLRYLFLLKILLCWCVHPLVEYMFPKQLSLLHYNGRPLVHSNKIKEKFKKELNLLHSSQYRVYKIAFFYVSTSWLFWWTSPSRSMQHVAGVKRYMIHHGGILFQHWSSRCPSLLYLFLLNYLWSLQHVADERWYMTFVMVAYYLSMDHWNCPCYLVLWYILYIIILYNIPW